MENQVQSQVMCSESITKLAKAMLGVQKVVGPAFKDKFNGFTQSKYATLNSVMEACGEALTNAGIWVTQYPVPVDAGNSSILGLVTKIVHAESGEWQSSLLVMPLPKNDPQGYGSALTYARRYGLSALVGIVTEDDDGNGACELPSIATLTPQNRIENEGKAPRGYGGNLPKIDGVTFIEENPGYIIASGNTRNKTSLLKEAGFHWDAARKTWWKQVQKMTA